MVTGTEKEKVSLPNFVNIQNIIDPNQFNDYGRLLSTAHVMKFIKNLKQKVAAKEIVLERTLSVNERNEAEKLWIQEIQKDIKSDNNFKQLSKDLQLFEMNGVLCCKGRLENAPVPFSTRFPIFLPKCYVTQLIIGQYHRLVGHNGVKETLNEMRSKFWISKGPMLVQSVIRKCRTCKQIEGAPYKYPDAPSLPSARLSTNPAFTHTAIDYAGPLYVRNIYDSKGMFKCWIFLLTCSSTRAIILDLVPDYGSPSCIRSLRRFFSRRGVPQTILSDNGTNFTAHETQDFASSKGVSWKFNPPASPWWGGVFERLVRCTKRCLKKVILNAKLTYEELLTALYEIEAILSNRPLTFTYETPGDQVLTPNHLIFGRRLNLIADKEQPTTNLSFAIRYKHVNHILEHFWKRWRTEYVTELREHHKCQRAKNLMNDVCNIGDVVQIHKDKTPRITFKVGVIEDFKQSRDSKRRVAIVKYIQNGRTLFLTRPVNKLYPLEVNEEDKNKPK